MPFIDTHVHLHFPDYDPDREETITRSREAGVTHFVNVGTDLESTRASLELAGKYDFIYATGGIHPHDSKDASDSVIQAIGELAGHPKFVAIGEVGLDYFRDHSPRERQKEVLRAFLGIHRRTAKPLVLHCRDAYDDLIEVLCDDAKPPFHGIIHCFSSDKPMMSRLLDLGFYISFAGPLTYKKNDVLREACRACPLDRLLLETDAPFLPPESRRGKRNESAFLLETAEVAAGLHGIPLETLGERTTENARKAFRL